jgi:hypothetical protein
MFKGTSIKQVDPYKYLEVTLDRTLTFKSHLEKAAKKVSSRVNFLHKLKKIQITKEGFRPELFA